MVKLLYTFTQLLELSLAEIEILCRGRPVVEIYHDFIKKPEMKGFLVELEKHNSTIIVEIIALKRPGRRGNNGSEEQGKTTITLGKRDSLGV